MAFVVGFEHNVASLVSRDVDALSPQPLARLAEGEGEEGVARDSYKGSRSVTEARGLCIQNISASTTLARLLLLF